LTSDSIGDIIINSVAIAFIMDIDNFCVEAFQSEEVSERSYQAEFEANWGVSVQKFTDGEVRPLDPEIVDTFNNTLKVTLVIVASAIMVTVIRLNYCAHYDGDYHSRGDA
jgi:hypothetical protein